MVKPKSKVRKIDSDKTPGSGTPQADGNKVVDSASANMSTDATVNVERQSSDVGNAWLLTEIRNMMFAFGDCPWPLLESVHLMEEILRQQMSILINQAAEVAISRGSRSIGLEELLFIMRRNKSVLNRVATYLSKKDFVTTTVKSAMLATETTITTDASEHLDVETTSETSNKPDLTQKRRKLCLDFLNSIDQTGEFLSCMNDEESFDGVKRERLLRADSQSKQLDMPQFMEFSKARRASFCGGKKRDNRFRDWLCEGLIMEDNNGCEQQLKPNAIALEIFNYLAQETIAQIVDFCLLVKKDCTLNADPALRGIINKPQLAYSRIDVTGNNPSSVAIKTRRPNRSPNSGPGANIEMINAIQPFEIIEVVRRNYQQSGPMFPFTKIFGANQFGRKLLF